MANIKVANAQPVFNDERSLAERAWFDEMPANALSPDYVHYFNDFLTAEDLDTDDNINWVVVKDTGAAVAIATDEANGAVTLTSAATTDDDGASIQLQQEVFQLQNNKKLWFECRVKGSSVADQDLFVGLSDAFVTNPEAVFTDPDRVGFRLTDGDATISAESYKDSVGTTESCSVDLVDDTYVLLGFKFTGSGLEFYVDRELKATMTGEIPDDENLCISLASLSGSATGTRVATIDYVWVVAERQ